MSETTLTAFGVSTIHAAQIIKHLERRQRGCSADRRLQLHCGFVRTYEVTLYERDWQLYYEGLVLRDHHGDAFDRNLATEEAEQKMRK